MTTLHARRSRETLGARAGAAGGDGFPDKDFMVFPDRNLRFTYAEFDARVNNLARGLLAIGIGKGDHVGIWATNVPDWLTFLFATAKIGAVTVTVNTAYRTHELEYIVRQSDIKALCLIDGLRDSDYVAMVNELVPELQSCQRGTLASARFPRLEVRHLHGAREAPRHVHHPRAAPAGQPRAETELARIGAGLDCRRGDQHAVHLGHHGLSQGRDAHPPQHPQQRLPHRGAAEVHRRGAGLPPGARSSTASAWCWA